MHVHVDIHVFVRNVHVDFIHIIHVHVDILHLHV